MDKVFRENKELVPITHKEFNGFIKGKRSLKDSL